MRSQNVAEKICKEWFGIEPPNGLSSDIALAIQTEVDKAVLIEREECAKVVDKLRTVDTIHGTACCIGYHEFGTASKAIRNRTEQEAKQ